MSGNNRVKGHWWSMSYIIVPLWVSFLKFNLPKSDYPIQIMLWDQRFDWWMEIAENSIPTWNLRIFEVESSKNDFQWDWRLARFRADVEHSFMSCVRNNCSTSTIQRDSYWMRCVPINWHSASHQIGIWITFDPIKGLTINHIKVTMNLHDGWEFASSTLSRNLCSYHSVHLSRQ